MLYDPIGIYLGMEYAQWIAGLSSMLVAAVLSGIAVAITALLDHRKTKRLALVGRSNYMRVTAAQALRLPAMTETCRDLAAFALRHYQELLYRQHGVTFTDMNISFQRDRLRLHAHRNASLSAVKRIEHLDAPYDVVDKVPSEQEVIVKEAFDEQQHMRAVDALFAQAQKQSAAA